MSSLSSLIGVGLLAYGIYVSILLETNPDLYIIGGLMAVTGILATAAILFFIKDKNTSDVDYAVSALFWSLIYNFYY